jgi:hypothetical protein
LFKTKDGCKGGTHKMRQIEKKYQNKDLNQAMSVVNVNWK